jgi:signal transduction histidine kinase
VPSVFVFTRFWDRRTWLGTIHAVTSLPIGVLSFTLAVVGVSVGAGLAVLFVGFLLLAATLSLAGWMGRVERGRVAVLLGTAIGDPHGPLPDGWWARRLARVSDSASWKELAHAVLLLIVGAPIAVIVTAVWAAGLVLSGFPAYRASLPAGTPHLGSFNFTSERWSVPAGLAGVVVLGLIGPWVVAGVTAVQRSLAVSLLGPSRSRSLRLRVGQLEDTRARSVDAAAAERQRIERDLHDGAQQRLVALAMDLGRAREKFDSDPGAARLLMEDAHVEAKRALVELRDLARGIHPAVLADGGLGVAVASLAARSPVPVTVEVDVAPRPPERVEAIAYFLVAEALANVARHSRATQAWATLVRRGDRLTVEIRDDGVGGADPARGTGLGGLADRVASVDGWFQVISPDGGPTTVLAELACGN